MQKVPIIQIKSDIYHQKQSKEADMVLSKIDQLHIDAIPSADTNPTLDPQNHSIRQDIISRFKNLFKL